MRGQCADPVLGIVVVDCQVHPDESPTIHLVRRNLAFSRIWKRSDFVFIGIGVASW
jgi:hypothetical protein